jgi:hypothetical protein
LSHKDTLIAAILCFERDTAGLALLDVAAIACGTDAVQELLGSPALDEKARTAIGARNDASAAAADLLFALRHWRAGVTGSLEGTAPWETSLRWWSSARASRSR